MPELPDKDEAIERLKRLTNEPELRDRAAPSHAYRLGQRWAMADAHPAEVARLEEFCRRYEVNRPVEQWKVEFCDRQALKELLRGPRGHPEKSRKGS